MATFTFVWQFWLCVLVLLALLVELVREWSQCWTKPALALYGTIAVWYLYNYVNDGPGFFQLTFGKRLPGFALLQVAAFLLVYRAAVGFLIPRLVRPGKIAAPAGPRLRQISWVVMLAWAGMLVMGLSTNEGNPLSILWPPLEAEPAGMFVTPEVGSGASFLINSCEYIYVLLCAWLGVLFVLETGTMRWALLAAMLGSWPYYWFGWRRNRMLALLLPMMACYCLLKAGQWKRKVAIGITVLLFVNLWFLVVGNFRALTTTQYLSIIGNVDTSQMSQIGVNMLEELCWSDSFIDQGTYKVNYGERYFAEAMNFVPRSLWPGKPRIGWDYAMARGVGMGDSEDDGIYATIATGMVGQGVVNFGEYFGVVAAAILAALWNCCLSRLWLQRRNPLRTLLFLVGLGLTFNMGRDISLLVLWPFVFGYLIVRLLERFVARSRRGTTRRPRLIRFPRRTVALPLPLKEPS